MVLLTTLPSSGRPIARYGELAKVDRFAKPRNAAVFLMLLLFGSTPCILFGGQRGGAGYDAFANGASSGPIFPILAGLGYGLAGFALLVGWRQFLPALSRLWLVWAFVVFAALTTAWSVNPETTAGKSVALVGTTLVAVYIGLGIEPVRQIRYITLALGSLVAVSLMMAVVVPGMAYDVNQFEKGRMLAGIYAQKNALGWATAITGIFALGSVRARALPMWMGYGIWALALIAAVASSSATGLLVLLLGGAIEITLVLAHAARRYRLFVFLGVAILAVGVWLSWQIISQEVLSTFGKTETLSGRGLIWEAMKPAIAARPWGGWGFSAFWTDPVSFVYMESAFWAGNAQGGYHEIVIATGFIGLAIWATMYIVTLIGLYRRAMRGNQAAMTYLAVMLSILVLGVTAPILIAVNIIFWMVTVLGATLVARDRIVRGSARIAAR